MFFRGLAKIWRRDFRRFTETVRTTEQRVVPSSQKNSVFYRRVRTNPNRLTTVVSVGERLILNVSSLARLCPQTGCTGFECGTKKMTDNGRKSGVDRAPETGRLIDGRNFIPCTFPLLPDQIGKRVGHDLGFRARGFHASFSTAGPYGNDGPFGFDRKRFVLRRRRLSDVLFGRAKRGCQGE